MNALRSIWRLLAFAGYFARELVLANAQVVREVLTPRSTVVAGIVELPLRSRTAAEITLMANLVSLTPGTLSLATVRDPNLLYVHGMFAGDREAFVGQLQELEERMLYALRGPQRADTGPGLSDGGTR